jgi:hypothetical protein
MKRTLIGLALATLLVPGLATAENRKAVVSRSSALIFSSTDKTGRPMPSMFWLPSGVRGSQEHKTWSIANGKTKITETRLLDPDNKVVSTVREVQGSKGGRHTTAVNTPSKKVGVMGTGGDASYGEPLMMLRGKSPITDAFISGKVARETKSWHAKGTRFRVAKEGRTVAELEAKPWGTRKGASVSTPVAHKGGGPFAPFPVYETPVK